MVTYDWSKIFRVSGGQPTEILNIIAYINYTPIPKNNYDPIKKYAETDWTGHSFLINPHAVLTNRGRVPAKELAEYVALASFRNYAEYLVTGRKTLALLECPVSLELLNNNRLLSISNDNVYFCWEETTH